MSPAQKAAIVSGRMQAVFDLALAGIRIQHPDSSPRGRFLRMAVLGSAPAGAAAHQRPPARVRRRMLAAILIPARIALAAAGCDRIQ